MPSNGPDEAAVARVITQLTALNDEKFRQALAESITSPRAPSKEKLDATPLAELVEWSRRVGAKPNGRSEQAYRAAIEAAHVEIDEMAAEERAAFRSPQLAVRSLAAAELLINNVNSQVRQNAGESNRAWQGRAERFRNLVGYERRILQNVVNGVFAQQGRLDNRPNPRRRAQERLWSLVMAGKPVGPSTLRELLADEERLIEERKAVEKEKRRQAKREARAVSAGR